MKVNLLKLNGFRNYKDCRLACDSQLNVFLGRNAQGKTNLLEAIYFLATARSPRTNSAVDLIHWDCREASLSAKLEGLDGGNEVGFVLGRDGRKGPHLNRKPCHRVSRLIGVLKAVFFMPDDLSLVKGGPSERRSFLDASLSQLEGAYLARLSRYQRALRQRNQLLKRCAGRKPSAAEFAVWDEQLSELGAELSGSRWRAANALAGHAMRLGEKIAGERLEVRYRSSVLGELGPGDGGRLEDLREFSRKELARSLTADVRRGYTSLGPHTDDLSLHLEGRGLRDFGSQGQQRTAVVALKMAMCEYFREVSGEYPLLLLDDITSELDSGRRRYLLDCLDGGAQVFLTATEGWEKNSKLKGARSYLVEDGRVARRAG